MQKRFKEGHENMENHERRGSSESHRTNENVEKVRNMVHSNRYIKYQRYVCATDFRQMNR